MILLVARWANAPVSDVLPVPPLPLMMTISRMGSLPRAALFRQLADPAQQGNKGLPELGGYVRDDPAAGVSLGNGAVEGDLGQNRQPLIPAKPINVIIAEPSPVDHGTHGLPQRGKGFPGQLKVIEAEWRGLGDQDNHIAVDHRIDRRATHTRWSVDDGIPALCRDHLHQASP